MPAPGLRPRLVVVALAALTTSLALAGCQQGTTAGTIGPGDAGDRAAANQGPSSGDTPSGPESTPAPVPTFASSVSAGAKDVTVDTPLSVSVAEGTFDSVLFKVHGTSTSLPGSFNADKTQWTADALLEPGTEYIVKSRASDGGGAVAKARTSFRTQELSLDQQTYANVLPLQNEVVGVGMPVIVQFDVPVADRAAFEKHMNVTAEPATTGSWHWISDQEVHWRPKTYWRPGTKVHVDVDVNGVDAGNGIYGQLSRNVDFRIGRSVVMRIDLKSDQMKVLLGGTLARTIPISGGQPGLETRSGTKLIIEKFVSKRMDAATVGIQPGSPDYYNIPDVQYAQRVTYSGEFLHAAPWSTYAQGSSNVSHGCVGMSTEDAAWLFARTHRGDPVEVTGTSRGLEDGNGWTDWNESFSQYRQASALD